MKTATEMKTRLQEQRGTYEAEASALADLIAKQWLVEIERRLEVAFWTDTPCEDFSVHSNQLEEVYDHRNRAVFDTAMLRAIDRVITTVMNLGFNARYHKSLNTCVWFISVFWGDAD